MSNIELLILAFALSVDACVWLSVPAAGAVLLSALPHAARDRAIIAVIRIDNTFFFIVTSQIIVSTVCGCISFTIKVYHLQYLYR